MPMVSQAGTVDRGRDPEVNWAKMESKANGTSCEIEKASVSRPNLRRGAEVLEGSRFIRCLTRILKKLVADLSCG